MLSASIFLPAPNVSVAMAFDRSLRQPFASPVIADSEHRWSRFRCSPLRLTTATAFGSRDCSLRLAYAYSTPLLRHGVGRSGFTCTRKLSLTAPLLSAVNPKPPLAFPSRRCRDAALTSSISHGCHTNRHIPPIHRGRSRQHSKPTAVFYYPSATLTPPRWAVRRMTASLRQCRRPLHSLRVTYGLGQGQVGLLSAVQAPQQKACRSAALHDTCHLL